MKDIDGEDIGIPIQVYLLVFAAIVVIVGFFDENMMFAAIALFAVVIIGILLDAVIGNKIQRKWSVLKEEEKKRYHGHHTLYRTHTWVPSNNHREWR